METLSGRKRKFPATWNIHKLAADSLYDRPRATLEIRKQKEVFTELMLQEAVIPPA
jgi:hypothetical protein